MNKLLSKTDFILYRECPKNVWYKIHRPDIYSNSELSEFEKTIIETGNEVELVARKLFPEGALINGRDSKAQEETNNLIRKKEKVLFQPIFVKDGYLAAVDILKFEPETDSYSIYEVKSTNDIDDKDHYHDLSFQVNLLKKCGIKINKPYLIHLNKEYVRNGEIDIGNLFKIVDVSAEVDELLDAVNTQMAEALKYLSQELEPKGFCCCIYKGRSQHCSTFKHSNPEVPEYSIHDITRIGNSKAKLKELIDSNIFHINKIPEHIKLSDIQQNQVDVHNLKKAIINKSGITAELKSLNFPLYFLDYETFPAAIPRFDGFSPYKQIPFQYSVHILDAPGSELKHLDFIYINSDDPSKAFVESLHNNMGKSGNILVWHKSFECGINNEIAKRIPGEKEFMDSLNSRVYDLEDVFKKQHYVHKDFKGSTSIKRILPALAPELSYKELGIQEGGDAADTWNKIVGGVFNDAERNKAIENLKTYCGLDTYAMFAIWRELQKITL